MDEKQKESFEELDLLATASALVQEKELTKHPSLLLGNPADERSDELWRCQRCGGCIRLNKDIKKGKGCTRCGSRTVVPAVPTLWETIKLFFRIGKIFLPAKGETQDV